jgi:hypothetical protein
MGDTKERLERGKLPAGERSIGGTVKKRKFLAPASYKIS